MYPKGETGSINDFVRWTARSLSLSLSFFVHRRGLKFRGVEHEKMREKGERKGEYYRLAGWKRSVARSHATSNLWCKRFWWVSLDPVAHHTLVVAPEFLDKSSSTMAHQGISLVRWRGTYLGENRLGISNTWPKFSYPLSMLCGYFRHRLSRCLGTIKIIYSTLFQGYRYLHPGEWLGQKWRITYSDYLAASVRRYFFDI